MDGRVLSHVSDCITTELVDRCLTALSAQTGYIMSQEYEIHHVGPGRQENT